MILIVDYGSQTTQLIARLVRNANVYCEVVRDLPDDLSQVDGIILSGGPSHVYLENSPQAEIDTMIPTLGICYGMQAYVKACGGVIKKTQSEYGEAELDIWDGTDLLTNVRQKSIVWNSHDDSVYELPRGFSVLASTADCEIAAIRSLERKFWGVQWHPEVSHSEQGEELVNNFLFHICGCQPNFTPENWIDQTIAQIRDQVGDEKVLLALSGGVDSSVLAVLLNKAIGKQLKCVFVDHGFHRENEPEEMINLFIGLGLKVEHVKCRQRFLDKLVGVSDAEEKRRIIGYEFIEVFKEITTYHETGYKYLAQGTIYSDVIESKQIKTHHNTALPSDLGFMLIEPLRLLFKDDVRRIGKTLGLPTDVVWRQPFPGVGLSIRTPGVVTKAKLKIARKSDRIVREVIQKYNWDEKLWQYFCAVLPVKVTGVKGDARSYEYPVVIRLVQSDNAMTATAPNIPFGILKEMCYRICNEVDGVNRVFYDITDKPSSTIEYE